jgi:hypothetical protein
MPRSDDSSLDPDGLRAVEARAQALLDRASAWGRFPTPVDDILAAANLKVAVSNAFDMKHVMAFIAGKASDAARVLRSALSKVLGVLDAQDHVIHIDNSVTPSKQTFLKLHEAGHHELPVHRRLFAFFQDCEKNLDPAIAELFEREANNFARFVLFQGGGYATLAADMAMSIKTPMGLASRFGASIYASCREFARTNRRECAVYVLEPAELVQGVGFRAKVRRIEASPTFIEHFGRPQIVEVTPDDALGRIVPIGRRLTRPTSLPIRDLNGDRVEAVGEAFDTTHNIILLVYTVRALKAVA